MTVLGELLCSVTLGYSEVCYSYIHVRMMDTLLPGVVTESGTLFINCVPMDQFKLLMEQRKTLLLFSTKFRNLLLLTDHQMVQLCQVGVVNHAHRLHPLVSEQCGRRGWLMLRKRCFRIPLGNRLTVTKKRIQKKRFKNLTPITRKLSCLKVS